MLCYGETLVRSSFRSAISKSYRQSQNTNAEAKFRVILRDGLKLTSVDDFDFVSNSFLKIISLVSMWTFPDWTDLLMMKQAVLLSNLTGFLVLNTFQIVRLTFVFGGLLTFAFDFVFWLGGLLTFAFDFVFDFCLLQLWNWV